MVDWVSLRDRLRVEKFLYRPQLIEFHLQLPPFQLQMSGNRSVIIGVNSHCCSVLTNSDELFVQKFTDFHFGSALNLRNSFFTLQCVAKIDITNRNIE